MLLARCISRWVLTNVKELQLFLVQLVLVNLLRWTKKEHGTLLVMMSGLKARDLAPAWLERTEANMTSLNQNNNNNQKEKYKEVLLWGRQDWGLGVVHVPRHALQYNLLPAQKNNLTLIYKINNPILTCMTIAIHDYSWQYSSEQHSLPTGLTRQRNCLVFFSFPPESSCLHHTTAGVSSTIAALSPLCIVAGPRCPHLLGSDPMGQGESVDSAVTIQKGM